MSNRLDKIGLSDKVAEAVDYELFKSFPSFLAQMSLSWSMEPDLPIAVHRSVLLHEVVAWLDLREGSVIIDGTAGAGGHSAAIAARVGESGRVIGLDRDPEMLELARGTTAGKPVTLVQSSYATSTG